MKAFAFLIVIVFAGCSSTKKLKFPSPNSSKVNGSEFYKEAETFTWRQRDSLAKKYLLAGHIPSCLKKFKAIRVSVQSKTGKINHAIYYVAPDYLSIGNNNDWARIPLTPMAAQTIADRFYCFLPTRKMVDDIYKAAKVKLAPVPMFAFRDSTITMWQHHLIIEGQRNGRKGLISGIKKDVVISGKILTDKKPGRVAIYGWHTLDGKPIQPLYTGHVNWYVDYSHGIRLIYRKIKVNGKWMDYTDVLKHKDIHTLLCDEDNCSFYKYNAVVE